MASLEAAPGVFIGEEELKISFARASGPGGQNVNKVETAACLRFDAWNSPSLDERARRRLLTLAGTRATREGEIVIFAQTHRSQELNRKEATERLFALIAEAVKRPKFRVKTRPSLSAKKRRADEKTARGAVKKLRRAPTD
ncbi:alternative ribosome rescue aminoacyl-tRNA hydrolase ArfB [Methylocella sp.]|uniref:alternative ribosome rescue aminoacyl-tRNA hydrolase ArfB n=1 Tax=Methylocella sp. TaxID=1978226 RepID=UPI003783E8B1